MYERQASGAQELIRRADAALELAPLAAATPPLLLSGLRVAPQAVLGLQRSAGNQAVVRLLARRDATPAAGHVAQARAAQEAEAAQTYGLARDAYYEMLEDPDDPIRNTARMLDPPGERTQGRRIRVEAMTLRSDSQELSERNPGPAQLAFSFFGLHQDNMQPLPVGVDGLSRSEPVVYLRGRAADGRWHSTREVIGTLVHEVSHQLGRDYGETGPALFERFRDEFRAYWITPFSDFQKLADPTDRAKAIRYQIVGYSGDDPDTPYVALRDAYWQQPWESNVFHGLVDKHLRPDGFNLTNSPLLDGLVHILRALRAGGASLEEVIWRIALLTPGERSEAASASLVSALLDGLAPLEVERIRRALAAPAAVGYGRELNPADSPRVTAVLDAVVSGAPETITATYERCDGAERTQLAGSHMLAWLREVVRDPLTRACILGMLNSRSPHQLGAVRAFLDAARAALGSPAMPPQLREAIDAMTPESRLAFLALSRDAYQRTVTPLAEPLRSIVHAALSGDSPP